MTSTPIETKAQKAAIATDATWDTENQFSVENQINQDQGRPIGTTLKDVIDASKTSNGVSLTSVTTTQETIPTGLDAIKAAGPQSNSRTEAYSEHK